MAVLKHEIARSIRGSFGQTEDWWRLCYDTDADEFFIEHEWDHANPYRGGPSNSGKKRHDAASWDGPGHEELNNAKDSLTRLAAEAHS